MPRHYTGRRPKPDPNATLYVVKVALAGHKDIWRRIAIRSDQSLDDLHSAIFRAFNRFDEHLYSFFVLPAGARPRSAMEEAVEYTSPVMIEDANPLGGVPPENAGLTSIASLGLAPGRRLRYLFDFGDEWWHDITVEQTGGSLEPGRYPRMIEKHGASPPQYPEPAENETDEEGET